MADKKPKKERKPSDEDTIELPKVNGKDTRRLSDLLGNLDDGIDYESDEGTDYSKGMKGGPHWRLTPVEQPEKSKENGYTTNGIQSAEENHGTDAIRKDKTGKMSTRKTQPVKMGDETAELLEKYVAESKRVEWYATQQEEDQDMSRAVKQAMEEANKKFGKSDYIGMVGSIMSIEGLYRDVGKPLPEIMQNLIDCAKEYIEKLEKA